MVLTLKGGQCGTAAPRSGNTATIHLGITSVSFAPTATNVKVLQTSDYYPFGMEWWSDNEIREGSIAKSLMGG